MIKVFAAFSAAATLVALVSTPTSASEGEQRSIPPAHSSEFPVVHGALTHTAIISGDNVWAVGCQSVGEGCGTLVEHWDGATWQQVVAPYGTAGSFNDVAAVSAKSIYAVGSISGSWRGLIAHWNGRTWKQVGPSEPNVGLGSLSVVSASDVWAAGVDGDNGAVYHFDGEQWSETTIGFPGGARGSLNGITAFAPDDAWAVGQAFVDGTNTSYLEHWDGTAWTASDVPGAWTSTTLNAIDGVSPDDLWAVGYGYADGRQQETLVLHYDGTTWQRVTTPKPRGVRLPKQLTSVSAASSEDVWAVGNNGGARQPYSLVEHWNGRRWSIEQSPGDLVSPYTVDTAAHHQVWMSGTIVRDGKNDVFTARWDGTTWVTP